MLLYEWYEAQRALMSPFSEFASASSKLYNHPLSLLRTRRTRTASRPGSS